ncbi:hypothetical protein ACH42_15770 [Endozoicomonas sp. (ex Bugula neritina AB1)]|nr:hypothetical protein ACH42_15770 [Endozoicomonas sp. (ex Bugula neritina AB1)]
MKRANVLTPSLGALPYKTTATLLLASAIASSAFAEITENKNSLSLKLRNYYQDRRPTDASDTYVDTTVSKTPIKSHQKQKAWGQGLEVNFDSAMFGSDTAGIGMDFSLYGGLKLLGDKEKYGTTVNKEGTPSYDPSQNQYVADQESYIKAGQIYAKGFVGTEGQRITAKAGWHQIERTLSHTYHRMTPTSFQGVSVDGELGDVDLYGSWFNKASRYNNDKMESLTSSDKNQKIDYVYTIGGSYNHTSGIGSELAYAESESYLKLYHANLNYTFNLKDDASLFIEGQYFKGKGNGDKWKNGSTTAGGFDNDANLYNLNAKLSIDELDLKASYSQIDAEKKGGLGIFDYHLAYESGADYDSLGSGTARQISDFNHNGEKVWQAGAVYSFDRVGAPGLSLGYTYTTGSDIKADSQRHNGNYTESEHNFEVAYTFQQEQLKGLTFTLQYAKYTADQELSEIKSESAGNKNYKDNGMTDLRVYIDYTVSVF